MSDLWIWIWVPLLVGITGLEVWAERGGRLAERSMRWPANLGLFFLEISTTSLLSAGLVWTASLSLLAPKLGFALAALPLSGQVPVLVPAFGFLAYWLHRFSHQVPLLWRFHRIHHSDRFVDPSTSLRHHPGEVFLTFAVFQLAILALQPSPQAVAVVALIERCFGVATHTTLALPVWVERFVGFVFVTPQQHGVHHSDFSRETNTNYGTVLNIWDRIFGTFRAKPLRDACDFRFGLREIPQDKAEDLVVLLALPVMGQDPWKRT
jgi:sterol desaturase/sphingolipid hydroxylase (fatty acid hydroxylase superfamily)